MSFGETKSWFESYPIVVGLCSILSGLYSLITMHTLKWSGDRCELSQNITFQNVWVFSTFRRISDALSHTQVQREPLSFHLHLSTQSTSQLCLPKKEGVRLPYSPQNSVQPQCSGVKWKSAFSQNRTLMWHLLPGCLGRLGIKFTHDDRKSLFLSECNL